MNFYRTVLLAVILILFNVGTWIFCYLYEASNMPMNHSWPLTTIKRFGDSVLRPHIWASGVLKGSAFGSGIVLVVEFLVVFMAMKFFFGCRKLASVPSRDAGKKTDG